MCKERCGAPLEPMRSKGSGLPRLKSVSVGSAEKRATGPFFVSASPRLALLVCPKVVRYLVYTNMVHHVTDHFFVQREVRSTSRTHAKQGFGSPPPEVGLGRFGGKKVHRTFFCVRLTPSRVFVLPKSGPLYVKNIPYNAPDNDQNKEYDIYPGRFGIKTTAACAYIIYGSIYDNPCNVNDYKWCKIVIAYSVGKSEFETTECETADSASWTV